MHYAFAVPVHRRYVLPYRVLRECDIENGGELTKGSGKKMGYCAIGLRFLGRVLGVPLMHGTGITGRTLFIGWSLVLRRG